MERIEEKALDFMVKAQLAAALEASAYPKPGNIHRLSDKWGKRFEQFIAGSIAMGPAVKEAFIRGYRAWTRSNLKAVGIGSLIEKAVKLQLQAHSAGNTHLGVIILFIPIASSTPMWMIEGKSIEDLGGAVLRVLRATTSKDANALMRAIALIKPSGLGKPPRGLPDASRGQRTRLTLYELLKESSRWDGVAEELTSGLNISLRIGLPSLIEAYERSNDVNVAIVHCFLKILSEKPDTFIARNVGLALKPDAPIDEAVKLGLIEAEAMSKRAREILELGGLMTSSGRRLLEELDRELELKGPSYNPGTTADLTATSILLALLSTFKML
ncbi:MAG: triphosphoribosyl-dephospho-CoA synthase [Candidatus Nezhaarchaeota archaeon]|nr:triphosphoribosyl-dephospho-CoA synthase [Candidatus Nezhaarchaeota archaeon]MCX8142529.1 triphosphoribosyl-dephospho-CoA synthase [Candidatus Nezhaarchaeota archaeon]MDW8050498.1 triphosphoribosyl-dephospho-CoA synthase [Nitrososphaerota archaeon]